MTDARKIDPKMRRCANCIHSSLPGDSWAGKAKGTCRINPPTPHGWPAVYHMDWCAHFHGTAGHKAAVACDRQIINPRPPVKAPVKSP